MNYFPVLVKIKLPHLIPRENKNTTDYVRTLTWILISNQEVIRAQINALVTLIHSIIGLFLGVAPYRDNAANVSISGPAQSDETQMPCSGKTPDPSSFPCEWKERLDQKLN